MSQGPNGHLPVSPRVTICPSLYARHDANCFKALAHSVLTGLAKLGAVAVEVV